MHAILERAQLRWPTDTLSNRASAWIFSVEARAAYDPQAGRATLRKRGMLLRCLAPESPYDVRGSSGGAA